MKAEFDHLDDLQELLQRYESAGPRYTSYPTAPVWRDDYGPEQFRESLGRIDTSDPAGLGIYVHVPFCRSLCHFCACNRVITQKTELPERYLEVIERELAAVREALPGEAGMGQLHFGGGTPTHLTPEQIVRLVGNVKETFPLCPGAEVSIEVDPRVTTDAHMDALEACGFNRISLGVQDFDERVQDAVHRNQSVEQVGRLTERARRSGFQGINFDLIYGLPFQALESFGETLDRVLELRPDRIALYSYAHVTWVAKQQRGFDRMDLPSGSLKLQLMTMGIGRMLDAGYEYIGMDHFAVPSDELAVAASKGELHRNFMGYTTRVSNDMLAFGPSGISEMHEGFAQSVRELGEWEERVMRDGVATLRGHRLSGEDRRRAWIIKRIMCQSEVSAEAYHAEFGEAFGERYADAIASLDRFEADGLLQRSSDGGITVTGNGRLLVRNIAMAFDAYLPAQLEKAQQGERLFSKTV